MASYAFYLQNSQPILVDYLDAIGTSGSIINFVSLDMGKVVKCNGRPMPEQVIAHATSPGSFSRNLGRAISKTKLSGSCCTDPDAQV